MPATRIQAYRNGVESQPSIEPFIDFLEDALAGI